MMASRRTETGIRVHGRRLSCAVLLTTACFTGQAHADVNADSERANLLFKKGKLAFNDGKYSDALRIYNEAWHLKQSPDIAANLAQTEAELGKHRDAAEHFAFALAHLLPSSTDEQKKALSEGLEVEKKEIGTLHVTLEPSDSQLSIDDSVITMPVNGDIYVNPGDHRASVTREGYEANQQTVHVSKGGSQVLWIKLQQTGAPTPNAATEASQVPSYSEAPKVGEWSSSRSMVPAVVGGGLVIAGAAVGVGFLLAGNSRQHDLNNASDALVAKGGNDACSVGTVYASDCAALHDHSKAVDRDRAIEVTGFVVAGAAAVGTAVYLLWPHSSATTSRSVTPSFAILPGAGTVGLAGRF